MAADPKTLAGIVQIIGLVELVLGSGIVPSVTKIFETHYEMTPEQKAELAAGYQQLMGVKQRIANRRAEIEADSQ